MLLTINKRGSKFARNSVLDCHSWPIGLQMAFENSVSNYFGSTFFDSFNVFNFRLSSVYLVCSNNDPRLALTNLPSMPKIPNPSKWEYKCNLEKNIF